jgi:uncharacterized membrane protein YhaH (DUF805 family)
MKWYLHGLKSFSNFDDRSSRTEYWMFVLFNTMFAILFYAIDLIFKLNFEKLGFGPFYLLYVLFAFLPGLALTVRRLHDVGRKGSFVLIALLPIIGTIWLLILFLTKSDEDENDYGAKPVNSDIAEFVNNDTINLNLLITALSWLLFNKVLWSIVANYTEVYYKNKSFIHFNELMSLLWAFFPILLSLDIKFPKWKIIFLQQFI